MVLTKKYYTVEPRNVDTLETSVLIIEVVLFEGLINVPIGHLGLVQVS